MVERLKLYFPLRNAFLLEHPKCEIKALEECQYWSCDVHHRDGREIVGGVDMLLQVDTFVAACRFCHEWAHNHPELARAINVSGSRLK